MEDERPQCSKKDCDNGSVIVMKAYTDEGPLHISFCMDHLFTISGFIDTLIMKMMTEEDDN